MERERRIRRNLCFLLVLALITVMMASGHFPARADNDWLEQASQSEMTEKINALYEEYPNGRQWTNDDPTPAYVWMLPGTIVSMGGCASFAAIIQDSVFGSIKEAPVKWQYVTKECKSRGISQCAVPYSWENLWPGDILQFQGHTVIVVQKKTDSVIIAEGNYCGQIRWGRELSRKNVETAKYVLTRYDKTELLMPYLDLPDRAHWSWKPVSWALLNQYVDPLTSMTFGPKKDCTRAAMITALWRACGSPEPQNEDRPFTDLSSDMVCYKAVYWAYERGITAGTSPTTFSPYETCTRAQALTMLWRAAGSPKDWIGKKSFEDVDSTDYYYQTINWATSHGITTGTSETTFSPKKTCSRAEAISFLYESIQSGEIVE